MHLRGISILLLALVSSSCTLEPVAAWPSNFEEAQARAARENKNLLALFTGSDWCAACRRLNRNVFQSLGFQQYAASNLVLVEIDFPRRKVLPPPLAATNAVLEARYNVQGFPTVILFDSKGALLRRMSGYGGGGWARFESWLVQSNGTSRP